MIFLTDTCFWLNLRDLALNANLDFRSSLLQFRWGVTAEVCKELAWHRIGSFFPQSQAFIVPISQEEIDAGQKKYPTLRNFDLADQTLFLAGVRDKSIILTDDGDLFFECLASGIDVLRLPHLCLRLAREGDLEKTDVYRALRYWKQRHMYRLREIKKWQRELTIIQ